jgi:hypothetical protein
VRGAAEVLDRYQSNSCLSGLHERALWQPPGGRCRACKSATSALRRGTLAMQSVVDMAERVRARRWQQWLATIEVTIARIRREEGFDSRTQEWQTFGEVRW